MNAFDKAKQMADKALNRTSQQSVTATREFVADFELVAEHYGLKTLGEYEHAKECARNDMQNAIPCYAELAREIRG